MSEAMSFCACLGIDVRLMYDIVSNAAGSSAVFIKHFKPMEEGAWSLQGMADAGEKSVSLISVSLLVTSNCPSDGKE